jgi:predicted NAD/FAD-binding protein
VQDNVLDRVPDERKDQARAHKDRAHEFLTQEYFPEERRDQFIYRMKKVIIECQKHSDYQESIRWLLSYVEVCSRPPSPPFRRLIC